MSGGLPEWLTALRSQALRAPVPSVFRPPPQGGRRSAILVLFGVGEDGPDVLLIQRSNGLRHHAGQPAFPGGVLEEADADSIDCALREAAEETGLDPSGVDALAVLPELYLAYSGFRVAPVLGWWRSPSPVGPTDTGEVAAVARVPVAELVDPANRLRVRHPGGTIGPAFRARGMLVWGFTAGVLHNLLRLGGWELPWQDTGTEVVAVESLLAPKAGN